MFEFDNGGDSKNVLAQLAGAGVFGYFAIFILISIPLAIIIYPRVKRSSTTTPKSKNLDLKNEL